MSRTITVSLPVADLNASKALSRSGPWVHVWSGLR